MNPTDRREQRLQSYKKARSEKEIYERVLAPTLYEFVLWVLQEALQSRKKRLYFLARDGYQMYLAAQQLCKQYDLDIECRYLKVSRYAVRVPEYHLLGERCLERICVGGIDVTFEKIMQRAALTDKEAEEIARLPGTRRITKSHQLSRGHAVERLLKKDTALISLYRQPFEGSLWDGNRLSHTGRTAGTGFLCTGRQRAGSVRSSRALNICSVRNSRTESSKDTILACMRSRKGREGKNITVFTSRRGVRSKEKCISATACLRQCFLHRRA